MITWKSNTPATYGSWSADFEINIVKYKDVATLSMSCISKDKDSWDFIYKSTSSDIIGFLHRFMNGHFENGILDSLIEKIDSITSYILEIISKEYSKEHCKNEITRCNLQIKHCLNIMYFFKHNTLSQLQ